MKQRILSIVAFAIPAALALACSGSPGSGDGVCSPSGEAACPDGTPIQACVRTAGDGECESIYYTVGSRTFDCASCADCTGAVESASAVCGASTATGPISEPSPNQAASVASVGFVGTWSCDNTVSVAITEPTSNASTSSSTESVSIQQGATGFLLLPAVDGGATCALAFTTYGTTATLNPGQSCVSGEATVVFTSGTAAIAGDTLDVDYSFELTDEGGNVEEQATGTLTSHCDRE